MTRYVDGLDGNLAVQTGKTGARVLQLVDLHGDVMTTLPIRDGESTADWTALRHQAADEYGNPTDLTTGAVRASTGQAPGRDGRYGWLGGKQRSADALAGVLLMGVRLYDPGTGRFWSVDPVPGGNATAYDYCSADPVNCSDLDGRWGWLDKVVKTVKKAAKVIAPIAELASMIPGPIGAAAAGVSAVAYAASGNKGKALEMGITAAAAMIPGGGAVVKAGMAAAKKAAGRVAAKAGLGAVKMSRAAPSGGRIVIGETMGRVRAAATKYNARTYEPGNAFRMPDTGLNRIKNLYDNYRWIRGEMKRGTEIIDIGIDTTRKSRSIFYRLERIAIKVHRYGNVRHG